MSNNFIEYFDKKELLRWAYRLFLGREPESEDILTAHAGNFSSLVELQALFFTSPEAQGLMDRFGVGYSGQKTPEDQLLMGFYLDPGSQPMPGYLTDFMGIRHSTVDLPFIAPRSGEIIRALPIPDDSFHAEAIEYVGLFLSIAEAKDSYTMFELGAGWGPWMCAAGVACRKRGLKVINLNGVEGDYEKNPIIKRHLTVNGLRPTDDDSSITELDGVRAAIYDGVVNDDGRDMEFPEVGAGNYGGSVVPEAGVMRQLPTRMVKGYNFTTLASEFPLIDLVHMDLQGYELTLLENCLETFKQRVKFLLIGTHTRKIEGLLTEFLYNNGFQLLRENPCRVVWPQQAPASFIDITYRDGTQIWRNTRFS